MAATRNCTISITTSVLFYILILQLTDGQTFPRQRFPQRRPNQRWPPPLPFTGNVRQNRRAMVNTMARSQPEQIFQNQINQRQRFSNLHNLQNRQSRTFQDMRLYSRNHNSANERSNINSHRNSQNPLTVRNRANTNTVNTKQVDSEQFNVRNILSSNASYSVGIPLQVNHMHQNSHRQHQRQQSHQRHQQRHQRHQQRHLRQSHQQRRLYTVPGQQSTQWQTNINNRPRNRLNVRTNVNIGPLNNRNNIFLQREHENIANKMNFRPGHVNNKGINSPIPTDSRARLREYNTFYPQSKVLPNKPKIHESGDQFRINHDVNNGFSLKSNLSNKTQSAEQTTVVTVHKLLSNNADVLILSINDTTPEIGTLTHPKSVDNTPVKSRLNIVTNSKIYSNKPIPLNTKANKSETDITHLKKRAGLLMETIKDPAIEKESNPSNVLENIFLDIYSPGLEPVKVKEKSPSNNRNIIGLGFPEVKSPPHLELMNTDLKIGSLLKSKLKTNVMDRSIGLFGSLPIKENNVELVPKANEHVEKSSNFFSMFNIPFNIETSDVNLDQSSSIQKSKQPTLPTMFGGSLLNVGFDGSPSKHYLKHEIHSPPRTPLIHEKVGNIQVDENINQNNNAESQQRHSIPERKTVKITASKSKTFIQSPSLFSGLGYNTVLAAPVPGFTDRFKSAEVQLDQEFVNNQFIASRPFGAGMFGYRNAGDEPPPQLVNVNDANVHKTQRVRVSPTPNPIVWGKDIGGRSERIQFQTQTHAIKPREFTYSDNIKQNTTWELHSHTNKNQSNNKTAMKESDTIQTTTNTFFGFYTPTRMEFVNEIKNDNSIGSRKNHINSAKLDKIQHISTPLHTVQQLDYESLSPNTNTVSVNTPLDENLKGKLMKFESKIEKSRDVNQHPVSIADNKIVLGKMFVPSLLMGDTSNNIEPNNYHKTTGINVFKSLHPHIPSKNSIPHKHYANDNTFPKTNFGSSIIAKNKLPGMFPITHGLSKPPVHEINGILGVQSVNQEMSDGKELQKSDKMISKTLLNLNDRSYNIPLKTNSAGTLGGNHLPDMSNGMIMRFGTNVQPSKTNHHQDSSLKARTRLPFLSFDKAQTYESQTSIEGPVQSGRLGNMFNTADHVPNRLSTSYTKTALQETHSEKTPSQATNSQILSATQLLNYSTINPSSTLDNNRSDPRYEGESKNYISNNKHDKRIEETHGTILQAHVTDSYAQGTVLDTHETAANATGNVPKINNRNDSYIQTLANLVDSISITELTDLIGHLSSSSLNSTKVIVGQSEQPNVLDSSLDNKHIILPLNSPTISNDQNRLVEHDVNLKRDQSFDHVLNLPHASVESVNNLNLKNDQRLNSDDNKSVPKQKIGNIQVHSAHSFPITRPDVDIGTKNKKAVIAPYLSNVDLGVVIENTESTGNNTKKGQQNSTLLSNTNALLDDLLSGLNMLLNPTLLSSTVSPPTTTVSQPCDYTSPTFKCKGKGMFTSLDTMITWCLDQCKSSTGCPANVCECGCETSLGQQQQATKTTQLKVNNNKIAGKNPRHKKITTANKKNLNKTKNRVKSKHRKNHGQKQSKKTTVVGRKVSWQNKQHTLRGKGAGMKNIQVNRRGKHGIKRGQQGLRHGNRKLLSKNERQKQEDKPKPTTEEPPEIEWEDIVTSTTSLPSTTEDYRYDLGSTISPFDDIKLLQVSEQDVRAERIHIEKMPQLHWASETRSRLAKLAKNTAAKINKANALHDIPASTTYDPYPMTLWEYTTTAQPLHVNGWPERRPADNWTTRGWKDGPADRWRGRTRNPPRGAWGDNWSQQTTPPSSWRDSRSRYNTPPTYKPRQNGGNWGNNGWDNRGYPTQAYRHNRGWGGPNHGLRNRWGHRQNGVTQEPTEAPDR